jgi:hypothetical protein
MSKGAGVGALQNLSVDETDDLAKTLSGGSLATAAWRQRFVV